MKWVLLSLMVAVMAEMLRRKAAAGYQVSTSPPSRLAAQATN